MLDYQRAIVDRLKAYTVELETALEAENWQAAHVACLGVYLAQDELIRTMPHGMRAGDLPFIT